MAEENIQGQPEGSGGQEDVVSVSRAELETYKAAQGLVSSFRSEAELMGFQGPDAEVQYFDYLRNKAYENLTTKKGPEGNQGTPEARPAGQPVVQPTTPPVNDERITGAQTMSAQAILESQFTNFRIDEMAKPETDRSKYGRNDLFTAIKSPAGPAIAALATSSQFEGNVFKAASFYLSMQANASQSKIDSVAQAAGVRAAASASLTPGVIIAPPGGGDPEAKHRSELANRIAPVTPDVFTGQKT